MIIRDVISQLLQYPMEAQLFVMQGDGLNPARAAEFTVSGPVILDGEAVNFDQPQVGFVICSEAEFAAAQQAQAEAEKAKEEAQPEEASA